LVAVLSKLDRVAIIGKARLTERGKPRRGGRLSFSQRTLNAVRKFIYWRHDGPCQTEDWVWHLDAVLPLLVQISKEKGHPAGWVRRMADEMFPRMDCCPEWWDEQIEEASLPVGIKVDTIAKRLGIKEIELDRCFGPNRRKRCGLVSVDRPKKIRAKERKEEKMLQRFFRRDCMPQSQSMSRDKPWCYFGISRATFYRRLKEDNLPFYSQAETTLTPNTLSICLGKKPVSRRGLDQHRKTASKKEV
jgi:hypothetical protein